LKEGISILEAIYDSLRTPRGRGKTTGALHTVAPLELGTADLKALPQRCAFSPEGVDEVIFGCVEAVDDQGASLARSAVLDAGWGGCGSQIRFKPKQTRFKPKQTRRSMRDISKVPFLVPIRSLP
jgi:hypothetical protein